MTVTHFTNIDAKANPYKLPMLNEIEVFGEVFLAQLLFDDHT